MSIKTYRVDLTAGGGYPTDPQLVLPFAPDTVKLQNEANAVGLYLSYDGANDALYCPPTPNPPVECHQRATKIWLRATAADAKGFAHVTVELAGRA